MAGSYTGTGFTPLGGAMRDYFTSVRESYKAARAAQRPRMDALKDARSAGKAEWTADRETMKTEGYIRKKTTVQSKNGSTPVSMPQNGGMAVAKTGMTPSTTGGFRVY